MPQSAAGSARQFRLLKSAQFDAVFSGKKSVHGRFFSCHVAASGLQHPRLGVTVSRRVSKKAVQRNRIKRQIRESFRFCRSQLPALDFVVVSKAGAADTDNRTLRAELDGMWKLAIKKCEDC